MNTITTRDDLHKINDSQYDGVLILIPESWCVDNQLSPDFVEEYHKWNELLDNKIIGYICVHEEHVDNLVVTIDQYPDSVAILISKDIINQDIDEFLEITQKDVFYISTFWDMFNH